MPSKEVRPLKAVVKESSGPGFVIKDVPIPRLQPDEVLIKVESAGICGTDIPIFDGVRKVPLPLIPGHEFSGVVVEAGHEVRGFRPGDGVAPGLVINCGRCWYCRQGLETLCDEIVEIGIDIDGGFAEYVKVPAKQLHRIPAGMTFDEAASVDPIASAYHGVKMAQVSSGDTVVVLGPGPIGLYALQIAKVEGAKKTVVVGTRESRLLVAKELGADVLIMLGKEDPVPIVHELTDGRGADVVIEATGSPESIDLALSLARKAGRVHLLGIFHEPAKLSARAVVRKEANIKGSFCYTWQDFQHCLDLLATKRVTVRPIVTHTFALEQMGEALNTIKQRRGIKVLLHP